MILKRNLLLKEPLASLTVENLRVAWFCYLSDGHRAILPGNGENIGILDGNVVEMTVLSVDGQDRVLELIIKAENLDLAF